MATPKAPLLSQAAPPPTTACSTVFNLPELLEIILWHLSPRDLLLSQRVNSRFQYTVSHSRRLQQALFLHPDWERDCEPMDYAKHTGGLGVSGANKPGNNVLLFHAFPESYPTVTLRLMDPAARQRALQSSNPAPQPPQINPAFQPANGPRNPPLRWCWDIGVAMPAARAPTVTSREAVWRPEASWRRMYLSQPPCTSLNLVRRWAHSTFPAIRSPGVTMGELVDAVSEGGTKLGVWSTWWIGSDGDWHFEGELDP